MTQKLPIPTAIGASITLDPERPEYHRATLRTDSGTGRIYATSTGFQRSSRLLSMRSANALLFLPKGPGIVTTGTEVIALVVKSLTPTEYRYSVHYEAAKLDIGVDCKPCLISSNDVKVVQADDKASTSARGDKTSEKGKDWRNIRVALLTISDRVRIGLSC